MKSLNWKSLVSLAAVAALLILGKSFASDGDKLAQNSTPPAIAPKADGGQSIQTTQVGTILVVKAVPTPPQAKELTAKALPNDQVTYTFSIDSSASLGTDHVHAVADFREISNISGTNTILVTTGSNAKLGVFTGGATSATLDIYANTAVSIAVTMPSGSAGKQYLLSILGTATETGQKFAGGDIISVQTPP